MILIQQVTEEEYNTFLQECDIVAQNKLMNQTKMDLVTVLSRELENRISDIPQLEIVSWGNHALYLYCRVDLEIVGLFKYITRDLYLTSRMEFNGKDMFVGDLELHYTYLDNSSQGVCLPLSTPKDRSNLLLLYFWRENKWKTISKQDFYRTYYPSQIYQWVGPRHPYSDKE